MSNVITYDIWILTFVCLCADNFLPRLVSLWKLYYLQLFTINAYHLNANIMLFSYVICNYIWHMGSLYYELICHLSLFQLTVFLLLIFLPSSSPKDGNVFQPLFCVGDQNWTSDNFSFLKNKTKIFSTHSKLHLQKDLMLQVYRTMLFWNRDF